MMEKVVCGCKTVAVTLLPLSLSLVCSETYRAGEILAPEESCQG